MDVGLRKKEYKMINMSKQKLKDYIWKRDNNICRRCGVSIDRALGIHGGMIHHIKRDSWSCDQDINTIILLCSNCHRQVHRIADRTEHSHREYKVTRPADEEIEDALKYVNFEYREI